jgi:large subunit ribosomal protein L5
MGIKEHAIFPEIDVDKIDQMHGMDITFVTSASTDEQAYALIKSFGMPFVKRNKN